MLVTIRVDGGGAIGFGHAMRCATLAAELVAQGHRVDVITASLPDVLSARFVAGGSSVSFPDSTSAAIVEAAPAVCVVDGYELGSEAKVLAAHGIPLGLIDDNRELPVELARLVLNQNPHAGDVAYPLDPSRRYLLGLEFALIRDDVRRIERRHREAPPLVLVAMGGTDPARTTIPVVDGLLQISGFDMAVAFGPGHRDAPGLQQRIADQPRLARASLDLTRELPVAELAVVGAGSTLWELAHLGIPTVAVCVAGNQRAGSEAAQRAGTAMSIDGCNRLRVEEVTRHVQLLLDDPSLRAKMSDSGPRLVDGRGAERVASALKEEFT